MYEDPNVTEIGRAKDLILGIASVGSDLDGSWVMGGFEFLHDDAWGGPEPAEE